MDYYTQPPALPWTVVVQNMKTKVSRPLQDLDSETSAHVFAAFVARYMVMYAWTREDEHRVFIEYRE